MQGCKKKKRMYSANRDLESERVGEKKRREGKSAN